MVWIKVRSAASAWVRASCTQLQPFYIPDDLAGEACAEGDVSLAQALAALLQVRIFLATIRIFMEQMIYKWCYGSGVTCPAALVRASVQRASE